MSRPTWPAYVDAGTNELGNRIYRHTLRSSIYSVLALPAEVGRQIGVQDSQFSRLHYGKDTTFQTEQLVAIFAVANDPDRPWSEIHPSLPDDLEAHDAYVLSGLDTLTPVEP